MKLAPVTKYRGSGIHRSVSAAETMRRVWPLMGRVGITRLADITGLDRVGIPVYSAIVPDSPDVLSVYNGKGLTKLDAKVGAVMEAVERHAAFAPPACGLISAAAAEDRPVLHPEELVLPLHPEFSGETRHALVAGFDLLTGENVLVPAQAVTLTVTPQYGEPCYSLTTTNGVAAGNTPEEAICHALCELIERDAWTLAELRARHLPQQLRNHNRWGGDRGDDLGAFADVDVTGAPAPIRALVRRFAEAGVQLRLKDITSDIGIATVMATTFERDGPNDVMAHVGLGTHPDANVAITRALTEVAQCRAVDMQAIREDLAPAGPGTHQFAPHTRRIERVRSQSWYHSDSRRTVGCRDLPHHVHDDVLRDIELMLRSLARSGLERVIAIDLTRQQIGIPVIRVLVPGLESWAADGGRLGGRADSAWREAQFALREAATL